MPFRRLYDSAYGTRERAGRNGRNYNAVSEAFDHSAVGLCDVLLDVKTTMPLRRLYDLDVAPVLVSKLPCRFGGFQLGRLVEQVFLVGQSKLLCRFGGLQRIPKCSPASKLQCRFGGFATRLTRVMLRRSGTCRNYNAVSEALQRKSK